MAKRRNKRKAAFLILWICVLFFTVVFAWFAADNKLGAAIAGAVLGLVVGIAILAFPNLDRGGPDDTGDMLH